MLADARLVLDTSVVVKLLQGKEIGSAIASRYGLKQRSMVPLISVVTVGELRSFSRSLGWGRDRRERLNELVANLVVVDINSDDVLEAYADISTFTKSNGLAIGDNDRWIAATAKVLDAVVLTLDKDFAPLHPSLVSCEIVDQQALLSKS